MLTVCLTATLERAWWNSAFISRYSERLVLILFMNGACPRGVPAPNQHDPARLRSCWLLGPEAGSRMSRACVLRVERGACGRGPRKSSPYSVLVDLLHDGLEHLARVRLYADGQQQLLHDSALVHQLHQGAGIHLQDLIVASTEEHARRVAPSGRIEGIIALRVYLAVGVCGVSAAKGSVACDARTSVPMLSACVTTTMMRLEYADITNRVGTPHTTLSCAAVRGRCAIGLTRSLSVVCGEGMLEVRVPRSQRRWSNVFTYPSRLDLLGLWLAL